MDSHRNQIDISMYWSCAVFVQSIRFFDPRQIPYEIQALNILRRKRSNGINRHIHKDVDIGTENRSKRFEWNKKRIFCLIIINIGNCYGNDVLPIEWGMGVQDVRGLCSKENEIFSKREKKVNKNILKSLIVVFAMFHLSFSNDKQKHSNIRTFSRVERIYHWRH